MASVTASSSSSPSSGGSGAGIAACPPRPPVGFARRAEGREPDERSAPSVAPFDWYPRAKIHEYESTTHYPEQAEWPWGCADGDLRWVGGAAEGVLWAWADPCEVLLRGRSSGVRAPGRLLTGREDPACGWPRTGGDPAAHGVPGGTAWAVQM